jgi:apolipoprotein N-acyltransferase
VALVPLFFALEKQRTAKAFIFSLVCGTVFFITTMFWLIHVTIPGMVILSVYLALYVAFFGLAYSFMKEKIAFGARVALVPALWVAMEFFRGHFLTGMPWALLGTGQASDLLAIQAADIVGAYGVSFVVVFVNICIFEFFRAMRMRQALSLRQRSAVIFVVFIWFAYGAYRIVSLTPYAGSDENASMRKGCFLKIAIVQGNIPQEIKWATAFQGKIFKKYQLLSEIVNIKDEPDLIVWPETSYPEYFESDSDNKDLQDFARGMGTPFLAGSISIRGQHYFNSAILFGPTGEVLDMYDKLHLVPFGEYIPARKFLPFIETILPIEDFSSGKGYTLFSLASEKCPRMRFGVLICFEDILSNIARGFVLRGADFLVNMTNDAWFGDTSSPYQHMQASVLRAVENRVYVLRAANTGISCFIDYVGRPYAVVKDNTGKPTFVTGYQAAWVAKTGSSSIYTKIGDVFAFLCIFYAIMIMILGAKKKR